MFINFFDELRDSRIPVSLKEFLSFIELLQNGFGEFNPMDPRCVCEFGKPHRDLVLEWHPLGDEDIRGDREERGFTAAEVEVGGGR